MSTVTSEIFETCTGRMAVLAAALLLAAANATRAEAQTAPPGDDLEGQVEAYVEDAWPAKGPGAAVLVARGGETVVATARGLADVETGEPLSAGSVFQLGSTTKQFTAAVVLQLIEAGRLALDEPLSSYLPGYGGANPDATLRQLLRHASGIPNLTDVPGWRKQEKLSRRHTTAELIDVFEDEAPVFAPGSEWSYSNSNYVLLGAVIEAVTGRPWHEAVRQRIAEPLGLETLRYGEHQTARAAMPEGYTASDTGQTPAADVHMSAAHAAGGLAASAGDLAAWMHALHTGRIVSRTSYEAMTTPTEPNDPVTPYGFGLRVEEIRGHRAVTHGGWIHGFTNQTVFVPSDDLYVAVLSNSDDPATSVETAARRLAALALGDPYPEFERVEPDLEAVEPLLGLYEIRGEDDTREFFVRDGKLYTLRSGSSESRVYSAGGDRFFYGPGSLTWFEVVRSDDGEHRMEMHQQGRREAEVAVRTGPVPEREEIVELPEDVLRAYVGDYRLDEDVVVTVARGEEGLTVRLTGQSSVSIRPTSETEFRVEGIDARVEFRKTNGRVQGLVIHQGGSTTPLAERIPDS